jgi:hypothetical protein
MDVIRITVQVRSIGRRPLRLEDSENHRIRIAAAAM